MGCRPDYRPYTHSLGAHYPTTLLAPLTVGGQRVVDGLVSRGAVGGAPRRLARVGGAEGVEDLI